LTSNRGQPTGGNPAIWVLYSRRKTTSRKNQRGTKYYRGHRTLQVVVCSRYLVKVVMWVLIYLSIFCSANANMEVLQPKKKKFFLTVC